MRTNKHEKPPFFSIIPIKVYLSYLIIVTLIFSGVSISKFSTTVSSNAETRVAIMAEDVVCNLKDQIFLAPGETEEIVITLTNKEDGKVCEVSQQYSMIVRNLSDNLELNQEYFLIDGLQEVKVDKVDGIFEASKEKSVTYKIKITWPNVPQPETSAFEVDALQVVINTEQID